MSSRSVRTRWKRPNCATGFRSATSTPLAIPRTARTTRPSSSGPTGTPATKPCTRSCTCARKRSSRISSCMRTRSRVEANAMFGLGRRMLGHQPEGVNIPITPMLDMTFQLLFFFIVNYNPPTNEGAINYNLPAPDETAATSTIDNPKPSGDDSELELKTNAELTVLVRTQHDGNKDG